MGRTIVAASLLSSLLIVPSVLAGDARAPASIAADHENQATHAQPVWDTSGRCEAKAKAFWKALAPADKQSLKGFLADHPYVAAELPEAISALEAGKDSEAQNVVRDHYGIDGKLAANVTALMAYANGIESACPEDKKSETGTGGEGHGEK